MEIERYHAQSLPVETNQEDFVEEEITDQCPSHETLEINQAICQTRWVQPALSSEDQKLFTQ